MNGLGSLYIFTIILLTKSLQCLELNSICRKLDIFQYVNHCFLYDNYNENKIYILYDINPVEGFNLRRDVYIRMAVFAKNLQKRRGYGQVKLVLPPFRRLYHWKSSHIDQNNLFWNHFFDLDSLKRFANVIDIWEYFEEINPIGRKDYVYRIDDLLKLQNFENMFENGQFIDKFKIEHFPATKTGIDKIFNYQNITVQNRHLVRYQGSAMMLFKVLEVFRPRHFVKHYSVVIENAEIVLHDHWGNREFWKARRSMRFNSKLVEIANTFRKSYFNSTDEYDLTVKPLDWRQEKSNRRAVGGNFVCAHIRRGDFVYGREKTTPTLRSVANQIRDKLKELQLDKVFISSDCSGSEYKDLKSYLVRYKLFRFKPESAEELNQIKDGGIAIVDQIVCSHAQYFIGTYESTFTYRIYEEREILGFQKSATFNTFCKYDDTDENCSKNSVWPIVY